MAKSSSKSSGNGSYTATQNSDGSVTYTNPSNGNSITMHSNGSYTTTSSSGKTYSGSVGASAASTFNSTYGSTGGGTISNGTLTANPSSSSSSSGGGGGSGGGSGSSIQSTPPQYSYCDSDGGAYKDGVCMGHWDIVTNGAQVPTSGGGGGGGNGNGNGNGDGNGDKVGPGYPSYPEIKLPDYSGQFDSIKNYISNLESSVTGDISGLKNLMNESNTMFQSKLDAQLQAQRELENKFNEEWSRIEGKMDENTRAQKDRLDQMEQKYTESLNKTQEMLEEYYSSTREVLERRASSATAAAASELGAKGLNSAVIDNTAEGKRLQMQDAINQQIKANAEMQQQLNNDYQEFMVNLVNQHNTLDQNQINFLKEGLNKKQELWNASNQYIQDYINNVYKPAEEYYNNMTTTYNNEAKTRYEKEREVAEYKAMNADARAKTIFDRLVNIVGDGNIDALSQWDLNLIKQVAERDDIGSVAEACAVIIKGATGNSDSVIGNAVSTASSNGTLNVNGTPSTYTKGGGNKLNYNDDSDDRLKEISKNVTNYKNTKPELFKDRNKYNEFFHYSERGETQKALLDYLWDSLKTVTDTNTNGNGNNEGEKLTYINPSTGAFDGYKALENIKNGGNNNTGKRQWIEDMLTVIEGDKAIIKKQMAGLDKNSEEYTEKNKLLTQYDKLAKDAKAYSDSLKSMFNSPKSYQNMRMMAYNNIIDNKYLDNATKKELLGNYISEVQRLYKKHPEYTTYGSLIKELTSEYNKY